ncbi:MAG: M16 family metallopeptidase [Bacillota bacterium]|jgi:predicted Zn-dependent peptidase|nr:insulinase family protein [Candidatus Fermentithermobacillaceae bacterium]
MLSTKKGKSGGIFNTVELGTGILLHYLPESKWKTLSIDVFCKIPAMANKLAALSLVPRLAARGTADLPTMQHISRFLEDMYGAAMGADARKVGPIQVIRFGIDLPSPAHLGWDISGKSAGQLVSQAFSFVWDLATSPNLRDGAYPQEVFEVERDEHRRAITGLINNRPYYATLRLMDEISQGDPRGLPAWGKLPDLEQANPRDTWDTWKQTLSQCPISIYVVGEGAGEVAGFLSDYDLRFPCARSEQVVDISKELDPPPLPENVLRVEDFLPGEQTVLCMAFGTGIREGDPLLPAMLFCDGILGGFSHSKLFTVVREQYSLAYFSDTIPNTWRGLIIATSGISDSDRAEVESLISGQVEAMKKGDISDKEMESIRMGLVRRLMTEGDSQTALVMRSLSHEILGGIATPQALADAILKVTKEDVVKVASQMELKAVYTLRAKEDAVEQAHHS